MSQTLLVGCSYLSRLTYRLHDDDLHINGKKYKILASPGSGNQAISARVLYEVSQQTYDRVIVLWSGVNRLDFPVSDELNNTYPKNSSGNWVSRCPVGSAVWFHSGGILGTGPTEKSATPEALKQFFQTQYLGTTSGSKYLSELTLMSIATTQSVLDKMKIPYQMGFIYNAYKPAAKDPNEHTLGKLDRSSPLFRLIDWYSFTQYQPPYEWAKQNNKLEADHFHPTRNAMIEWFRLGFDIDLTV